MNIPVLETKRMILRAYRPEDFEFYFSVNGDAEVMRFIVGKAQDRTTAFRAFCAVFGHWHVRGYGAWAMEEKNAEGKPSGRLLGHCGLPHWNGAEGMEVGYALHRSAWGKGFASEAAERVVRYGHEVVGAREVLAVIHPDNASSIRVAEKLGARYERDLAGADGMNMRVYVHRDPI